MLKKIYAAGLGLILPFFLLCATTAQTTHNLPLNANMDEEQTNNIDPTSIPGKPFRIVGFGDSLMAGYLLEQDQSFAYVLEKRLNELGYEITIDNAGVSGDTTTAGLARLDWSVPDNTDLVILELGANDMLRGIAPNITEQNLNTMLARFKKRNIHVLFVGMQAAPNMGAKNVEQFNTIYPKLAQRYNVTLYPFFLDGVVGQSQYQLSDGMHPNQKGIEIMVERFLPIMTAELKKLGVEATLKTP